MADDLDMDMEMGPNPNDEGEEEAKQEVPAVEEKKETPAPFNEKKRRVIKEDMVINIDTVHELMASMEFITHELKTASEKVDLLKIESVQSSLFDKLEDISAGLRNMAENRNRQAAPAKVEISELPDLEVLKTVVFELEQISELKKDLKIPKWRNVVAILLATIVGAGLALGVLFFTKFPLVERAVMAKFQKENFVIPKSQYSIRKTGQNQFVLTKTN